MTYVNISETYEDSRGQFIVINMSLPRYVQTSKVNTEAGKKYYLNLNNYNSRKYYQYNNIKKAFTSNNVFTELKDKLSAMGVKIKTIDSVDYLVVIGKDLKKFDRGNVVAIFRKMFEDALVDNGIIEDDNDTIIRGPVTDHAKEYQKGREEVIIEILACIEYL